MNDAHLIRLVFPLCPHGKRKTSHCIKSLFQNKDTGQAFARSLYHDLK
ncbi:hypothetical protein STRCR_1052 [Streptococcus criceti HS-6]|uniref:Uncharacterized protein n=1 Tax=Streptococcus criceti HS-6 TaxID=873449 RepID=G5JT85_STRCG|nr:hypothetical protein STRCR_1052 [Streptococcus criceti HS-6]